MPSPVDPLLPLPALPASGLGGTTRYIKQPLAMSDNDVAAGTIERTLALVEPVLGPATENGSGPFGTSEWCFPCPLHSKGDPTSNGLILSIHRNLPSEPHWFGRKCYAMGIPWSTLVEGLIEYGVPPEGTSLSGVISAGSGKAPRPKAARRPPARVSRDPVVLPDEELIEIYAEFLLERPVELAYLTDERLWNVDDIKRLQIGWHPTRKRYLFPQRDEQGELVNVRLWAPHAPKGNRWLHWRGHGKNARMWPLGPLLAAQPGSRLYLCGGEPDTMAALAQGVIAVTGHAGEGTLLKREDMALFAGHYVCILYDS